MRPSLAVALLWGPAACLPAQAPVAPTARQAFGTSSTPAERRPRLLDAPETPPALADPDRKANIVAAATRLDPLFAAYAERGHVPGLAVGLVVDRELVWAKGYSMGPGRCPSGSGRRRLGSLPRGTPW